MNEEILQRERLKSGVQALDIVVLCGAAKSKSEARTLIKQGGITLIVGPFQRKILDCNEVLTEESFPRAINIAINGESQKIWVQPSNWELKPS